MKLESEKAGVILGFIGVSWVSRGTLVSGFLFVLRYWIGRTNVKQTKKKTSVIMNHMVQCL